MLLRADELRDKEVIGTADGAKIGYVYDVEMDSITAKLTALIVPGRLRLFGLLGREEDIIIPWGNVVLIGDDTILTDFRPEYRKKRKSFLSSMIEFK